MIMGEYDASHFKILSQSYPDGTEVICGKTLLRQYISNPALNTEYLHNKNSSLNYLSP
jgi:hypothetical protein